MTNLTGKDFANEWMSINADGLIVVKGTHDKGYAWDGCSPKLNFLHLIWGTADGAMDFRTAKPFTYYASMIHDILYQFKKEVPVSRMEADILFAKILRKAGFIWWWLYGFAVIVGGGIYGGWATKKSRKESIMIKSCSWPTTKEEVMEGIVKHQLQDLAARKRVH
jgi:hypothetical protein